MNRIKETKHYSKEFKEQAVQLSYERDKISQVAKELGVDVRRIYQWPKESEQKDPSTPAGKKYLQAKAEKRAEKQLEKENRRLKMENEILKKAIAFISERDVY